MSVPAVLSCNPKAQREETAQLAKSVAHAAPAAEIKETPDDV
jgi:hypothetical protein